MIDSIQNILVQVSDFLWSYIIITVLICCALFFTWRTRFVQFRLIREMIRLLIHPDKVQPEEIGHDELSMEVKVDGEMKHISSFQAFVVALASRIWRTGLLYEVWFGKRMDGYSFCRADDHYLRLCL